MKLVNLKQNQTALVTGIEIKDLNIMRRICDMGIYSGQQIQVLKTSVFKKAILVSVKNYTFSIQNNIAKQITVRPD